MAEVSFPSLINPFSLPVDFDQSTLIVERVVYVVSPFFVMGCFGALTAVLLINPISSSIIPIIIFPQLTFFSGAVFFLSARKVYHAKLDYFFTEIKIVPPSSQNEEISAKTKEIDEIEEGVETIPATEFAFSIDSVDPLIMKNPFGEGDKDPNNKSLTISSDHTYSNQILDSHLDGISIPTSNKLKSTLFEEPDSKDDLLDRLELDKDIEQIIKLANSEMKKQDNGVDSSYENFLIKQCIDILYCFRPLFNLEDPSFIFYLINSFVTNLTKILLSKVDKKELNRDLGKDISHILKSQAQKDYRGAYSSESLKQFCDLLDSLKQEFSKWFISLNHDMKSLAKDNPHGKSYCDFLRDLDYILEDSKKFLISTVGDISIGEFFEKSQQISEQFTDEPPIELIKNFLDMAVDSFKKTGLKEEASAIQKLIDDYVADFFTEAEDPTFNQALFQMHIHDLFLFVLIGFYAAEHFHLLRPFLVKHEKSLINFLLDLKIKEINKHKTKIDWGIKLTLAALAPINGIISSDKIPFKSTVIKKTINVGFECLINEITSKKESTLPLNPNQQKMEELAYKIYKGVSIFLILGIFGSKKDRNVYQGFKLKLTQFYKGLYIKDEYQKKKGITEF